MAYETILVETRERVGLVTLNRPQALNALNGQLMSELTGALQAFDDDDQIGAIVLTGSERAFAAGADIKEMTGRTVANMLKGSFVDAWDTIRKIQKPIIAAVSGWALGGGCELARDCGAVCGGDGGQNPAHDPGDWWRLSRRGPGRR